MLLQEEIEKQLYYLSNLNPNFNQKQSESSSRSKYLRKVLVANRGEIAKRFFLSLREEGIRSVAVVTNVDLGQSWYEFADEVVCIGEARNYTNIPVIISAIIFANANAVYPGYGFLSENINFVENLENLAKELDRRIIFMGPKSKVMKKVGDKLAARTLAKEFGVPLFEGSSVVIDEKDTLEKAEKIGYPVMLKLSAGGGGKGMFPIFNKEEISFSLESSRRIGKALYNDERVYLEKLIQNPVHMEVQIFNGTAIGIRKCAVQRRNQKIIEETGDYYLTSSSILSILSAAENMAKIAGYEDNAGAGTVEFLFDPDTQQFGFLEMNTRLQVEHPVTDQSLSIDLAKWQILLYDGRESEIDYQKALRLRFTDKEHAIECRIYAEDPESAYAPSPGKILEMDLPTFNGIRCDFGFKKGDMILSHYDPMIGKIIATGETRKVAITRMLRSLNELYVKGLTTNINQLISILRHPEFIKGNYTNKILENNSSLVIPEISEDDVIISSIIAASVENIQLVKNAARECFLSKDLENSVSSRKYSYLSSGYIVDTNGYRNTIQILQTLINTYNIYFNQNYYGEIEITSKTSTDDDYLIRLGLKSYSVRYEKRPNSYIVLRMEGKEGSTNYFRLKIHSEGLNQVMDPPGMVRSPFRGMFVGFSKIGSNPVKVGATVKKDDPILIISSMKMETVIKSPVNGRITKLVGDGNESNLILNKLETGQVIGKNLTEGEVLFVVEEISDQNDADSGVSSQFANIQLVNLDKRNTFHQLYNEELTNILSDEPEIHVLNLLKLTKSYFQGFITNDNTLSSLNKTLSSLDVKLWNRIPKEKVENEIYQILYLYTNIKKLYSPNLGKGLSLFFELNQYLNNWREEKYSPSEEFRSVFQSLLKLYNIQNWIGASEEVFIEIQLALFYIQRAYFTCLDFSALIQNLIRVLFNLNINSKKIINLFKLLRDQEEQEKDNFIAEYLNEVLLSWDIPFERQKSTVTFSRKYFNEFKKLQSNPFTSLQTLIKISEEEFKNKILLSIKKPEVELTKNILDSKFQDNIEKKIKVLEKSFEISRLYSPIESVLIYGLTERTEKTNLRYLAFSNLGKIVPDFDEKGTIVSSERSERQLILTTTILQCYQKLEKRRQNRIEIIAVSEESVMDHGDDPKIFSFDNLLQIINSVKQFILFLDLERLIVDVLAKPPFATRTITKRFDLHLKKGSVYPEILQDRDHHNPYAIEFNDEKTKRLFEKEKWPVEVWAEECFDVDSFKELSFSITDSKLNGSKLFIGKLGGRYACFYMKDSRINGGSTGDLEGLKYLAACYLAFVKNIPLYVWNDGAGANIKEGMISLNRAGQGFMMNALLGDVSKSRSKFILFTKQNSDPKLRELFEEVDSVLDSEKLEVQKNDPFLVAVGIGSSTGLDVYGSSQAAIQIMIDHKESYRVLTGSNVIKSVTGEDLSNNFIGGARVMEQWTGTVDIVAKNKVHLITIIRKIHEMFYHKENKFAIDRKNIKHDLNQKNKNDDIVISEEVLFSNIDKGKFLPFKEEYHGTGSLLGGFTKLSGRPVLILGARSNDGLRSFTSILRAKELLSISYKTNVDQVLIFGDNWFNYTQTDFSNSLRASQDFLTLMNENKGKRIHLVTSKKGLENVYLNHSADAIIFVKNSSYSEKEIKEISKIVTFIAGSFEEAFDCSSKLLHYFNLSEDPEPTISVGMPKIPEDYAMPYDILENIIYPTLDKDSFIEFFQPMNDPIQGPSLITGLGRLNGKVVGVIADQPFILGGAPDAPGTEKFRLFTELLNKNKIPLIMFSNAPGFVPGTKQERLRIQQIGAESLNANIQGEIPVVSVVLNQNYGGRQIHAFSKSLRPGITYLALRRSIMSVMGASASFSLFCNKDYLDMIHSGKAKEAEMFKEKYISDFNQKSLAENDAFKTGILDWLIDDVKNLRSELIRGLQSSIQITNSIFP